MDQQTETIEGPEIIEEAVAPLREITRAELDGSIATAKQFPRSLTRFQHEVRKLCCLTEEVAAACLYALPRTNRDGQKVKIEGPSIRFAEILMSAWGNGRVIGRILDTAGSHVVAQGVFIDLERNITVSKEVRRRITDRNGRRYGEDMINVTANAAISIACRNAILAGIPRAIWQTAYEDSRATAIGTMETLEDRRSKALNYCMEQGIVVERVYAALGVDGLEAIGLDHLGTLRALVSSVRHGDTPIDVAFPPLPSPGAPAIDTEAAERSVRGMAAIRAAAAAEGGKK